MNLILELNSVCNSNCIYCYLKDKSDEGISGLEYIKERLCHFAGDIKDVDFTGGEPTLSSGLPDVVKLAKDLGYVRRNLVTNGRRIAYSKYLDKLIDAGINRIIISVDGADKDTAEIITRSPGSFAQTLKAIRNVRDKGMELGTTTVITRHNFSQIPDIVDMCVGLGSSIVNLQYILPYITDQHVDCRRLSPGIIPSYDEVKPFVKEALDSHKDKIRVHFIPFCLLKGYEKNIDHGKDDRLAVNFRGFCYNIGEHLRKGGVRRETCRGCVHDACPGFFESYPELEGKDE